LRYVVLHGNRDVTALSGPELERDDSVVDELPAYHNVLPQDVFFIASNSGVNKSIIGMSLAVEARGHKLIAVTSLDHSRQVPPLHVSGKRLYKIADVVIDNLAPRGDTVLTLESGAGVCAVSSTTLMRPLRQRSKRVVMKCVSGLKT